MKLSTIIFATVCYAAALPTYAQEPAQAPAPARMQYENWQQLPPQVRAALLFIMAAGFDSMAATEEQGLDPDSAKAHALFLELVLKLDVSFMDNGQDRLYFETMLNINRDRLTALQALPESAGHAEVEAIRTQHAEKLKAVKKQYGYENIDTIVTRRLPGLQQKYMEQCVKAHPHSVRAALRLFAEKLREESIMQH